MTGSAETARLHAFADMVERLVQSDGDLHRAVVSASPHMAPETMAAGLGLSLRDWDLPTLERWISTARGRIGAAVPPAHCVVILGGVLPPSHVQALAYPWLLGARLSVKVPSRDPAFPALLCDALGDGITTVSRTDVPSALADADAAVVVGDDDSVRELASQLPVSTPVLMFGDRTSIGLVVGSEAANDMDVARRLTIDISSFDQLGCLSPREILVVGTESDGDAFAEHLARALRARPDRYSLPVDIEGAIRGWVDDARLDGAIHGPRNLQWGIATQYGGHYVGSPGGRHVIVRTIRSLAEIRTALAPIAGKLSAVSHAGIALDQSATCALVRLGASRIVEAGRVQATPPSWPHDGVRPLDHLCRFWSSR